MNNEQIVELKNIVNDTERQATYEWTKSDKLYTVVGGPEGSALSRGSGEPVENGEEEEKPGESAEPAEQEQPKPELTHEQVVSLTGINNELCFMLKRPC